MAFNPFLAEEAEPAPLNPFAFDAEPAGDVSADDNPFAASNPFADFGAEPAAGNTVPVDMFGGGLPTAGARLFDPPAVFEPPAKPTELPLTGSRSLPPATQELILSVTGHMDYTSSHLLGRIPLTRTPSPVSARDFASPEPDGEESDLPELPLEPEPEPAPAPQPPGRPARPPPPPALRPPLPPPPRPAPPSAAVPPPSAAALPSAVAPPSAAAQPTATGPPPAVDDINLFDAPATPVTKTKPTKEDILSLYSAPKKEEKQIDFLSDDLLEQSPVVPMDWSESTPCCEGNPFQMEQDDASPFPDTLSANSGVGSAASQSPALAMLSEQTSQSPMAMLSEEAHGGDHGASPQPPHDPSLPAAPPDQPPSAFPETQHTNVSEFKDTFPPPATTIPTSKEVHQESSNAFTKSNDMFSESSNTFLGSQNVFSDLGSTYTDSHDSSLHGSENLFGSELHYTFPETQNDPYSGSNTAFSANQNTFQGQNDAFTQEHDVFQGSQNAFAMSQTTLPETHDTFPQSLDNFPESHDAFPESQDAFDAFSAKFDSTAANHINTGAWGDDGSDAADTSGFEAEAFDPFLSMGAPPPPTHTPRLNSQDSQEESFSVFIRPQEAVESHGHAPALAPPPRPAAPDRANPFDQPVVPIPPSDIRMDSPRRDSKGSGAQTPPTPLFDDDVSVPLEDFPRIKYEGPGWEMHLRQPNKKKITGQRFWKKVWVRLAMVNDTPVVQLRNTAGDKEPFQELPLQACYSVSEIAAQQFDQFGKIFTVKLQYVFYKERPGVRPGQVTKAERITNKLSQFAAYAIQGDYAGVKEFGSDLRKLGLPVEHAPQVSQLFKLGSLSYEDVKQFSCCIEEALFRLSAHRDRALNYKMEEVQVTAVDELYVEQDAEGVVMRQVARVRIFFLGFLSGMPDVELGVNDLRRQGKEVVGRHDIIPVATEEWIRVECQEFHACVQPDEFANTQIIRFKPPDACYIELMRFRVRPPKNRELPLQLKAVWCVTGNKVVLRADVLVPGFASRALGQVPCEDVAIRFPIPESWIYLFRVEKHFRYGSVKSAHRRTGKVKGIERFLGAVDTLSESLIEVTSGQAKYEHQHRAIVWRMPRLPKEGQGAYTTHNLVSRMALTSFDQIPAQLAPHAFVEFTMPATTVSHTVVRSVSLQNHDADEPPEKYVRYLARHEYIVGIERTSGESAPAYALAARPVEPAQPEPAAPLVPDPPSTDSDSD